MQWVYAILIGVLTGLVGAAVTAFVADRGMRWYRASNFEGAAGFALVFLWIPAGFIVGLIVGIATARAIGWTSAGWMWAAAGLGPAIMATLVAGTGALAYLGADFPPKLGGRELELDFELRCPPGFAPPPLDEGGVPFHAHLYSGGGRGAGIELDRDAAREADGRLIIPGTTGVNSSRGDRQVSIGWGSESSYYAPIPLPGRPAEADERWSDWHETTTRGDLSKVPPEGRFAVRYRVRRRTA